MRALACRIWAQAERARSTRLTRLLLAGPAPSRGPVVLQIFQTVVHQTGWRKGCLFAPNLLGNPCYALLILHISWLRTPKLYSMYLCFCYFAVNSQQPVKPSQVDQWCEKSCQAEERQSAPCLLFTSLGVRQRHWGVLMYPHLWAADVMFFCTGTGAETWLVQLSGRGKLCFASAMRQCHADHPSSETHGTAHIQIPGWISVAVTSTLSLTHALTSSPIAKRCQE